MNRAVSRRPTAATKKPWLEPRIVVGSVFAAAIVLIAAVAAWPIYRTESFAVLVVVSALVAAGICTLAWRRKWKGWLVAAVVAVAFLALGVPLAVPSRMGAPGEFVRGLGELAAGVAVGWKDLVTVDLPVGSYRNLLVPALVIFLAGTSALLMLTWLEGRRAFLATPVALAMVSFGLFFGRADVSAPLPLGPITLYAPLETALGVTGLFACLLWLSWRNHDERARSLQRAAASSGVRIAKRANPADRRRAGLGVGMIASAIVLAVAVVPFAARGTDREVLRSAVGPRIDLSAQLSPLSEYRTFFDDARADDVLFTVDVSEGAPDRVRLATLTEYDGEVFRTGDGAEDGRFLRVPSALDAGAGEPIEMTMRIEQLEGLWMPTAGLVTEVEFGGPRATALADGFYYSAGAEAGVETAEGGFSSGDTYRLSAVEAPRVDLIDLEERGTTTAAVAPESVRTWVEQHATGTDGAALAGLVSLLRERGYLSHGLSIGVETPAWVEALGDYEFQPSASGHSLGRMDTMFSRLLERESDPRAAASDNFVAAIGDDEQFAVAVALVAGELGFPARVVVGARLFADDSGVSVCDEGSCRGRDVTAWTEVMAPDGGWLPIDVTPQYSQSPSLEVTQQRDPEVVTEVRPDAVEEIVPPDPLQQDAVVQDTPDEEEAFDLALFWPALRMTGIGLLVLFLAFGPLLLIVIAKARRRRARRTAPSAADRVAGAWDEYVDAAVDAGHEVDRAATRTEIAASFPTSKASGLAADADRAVFAGPGEAVDDDDAVRNWRVVDRERRALRNGRGFWRGARATVSLRSIIRPLAPAPRARSQFSERGKRSVLRSARPTQ